MQGPDVVQDVRLQPRVLRASAAALVDQRPAIGAHAHGFRHQAAGLGELLLVVAIPGHRVRDAVRGERQVGRRAVRLGEAIDPLADLPRGRPDEVRVVVEDPHLVDPGGTGADDLLGLGDVLAVLPAARIGRIRRQHHGQGVLHAGTGHLLHRAGEHRVPVPIPPINRQPHAATAKFRLQDPDQVADLVVDGAPAVEVIIMLGHLHHPLAGDVPPAQHVLQERDHVVLLLRPPEADDQEGVVIRSDIDHDGSHQGEEMQACLGPAGIVGEARVATRPVRDHPAGLRPATFTPLPCPA